MRRAEGDRFVLRSGRSIIAPDGVIGIDGAGYAWVGSCDALVADTGDPKLTSEERAEVALHMIERWARWGQGIVVGGRDE